MENDAGRDNKSAVQQQSHKLNDVNKFAMPSIKATTSTSITKAHSTAKLKTTTTVTKITKLILKPKIETKSKFTFATSKYNSKTSLAKDAKVSKPTYNVSALARRSIDLNGQRKTAIGNKKTKRSPPKSMALKLLPKENRISSTKDAKIEQHQCSIMNLPKTVENPILQEITSAIINTSSHVPPDTKTPNKFSQKSTAFEIQHSPASKSMSKECFEKCTLKSYDPIKARQFMRTQQKKRQEETKEKSKAIANKEEIKKRLENLQKNTRKIVGKNIKRAQSNSLVPNDVKKELVIKSKNVSDKRIALPVTTPIVKTSCVSKEHTPSVSSRTSSNIKSATDELALLLSQQNRIGILRRPEGYEASGCLNEAVQTPLLRINNGKSTINPIRSANMEDINQCENHSKLETTDFQLKVPETMSLKSTILSDKRTSKSTEFRIENSIPKQTDNKEIAYWLRPTPVQSYPYNFIMAVRKKLELITNPVLTSNNTEQAPGYSSGTKSHFKTPLGRPRKFYKSEFRSNLDKSISEPHTLSPEKTELSIVTTNKDTSERPYTSDDQSNRSANIAPISQLEISKKITSISEDYSTNFSSVTLKTPDSPGTIDMHSFSRHKDPNEMLSSTKISSPEKSIKMKMLVHRGNANNDSNDSQDTLSISSGILSQSSPEKLRRLNQQKQENAFKNPAVRQPSPLSTDHVDGLHIISQSISHNDHKSHQPNATKFINFSRGNAFSQPEPLTFDRNNDEPVNVQKMLNDFNESLSQVIKVNQKLHNVLSHPPSRATASISEIREELLHRDADYSDDFETNTQSKNERKTMEFKNKIQDEIEIKTKSISSDKLSPGNNLNRHTSTPEETSTTDQSRETSEGSKLSSKNTIRTESNIASESVPETNTLDIANTVDIDNNSSSIKESLGRVSSAKMSSNQNSYENEIKTMSSSTLKKSVRNDADNSEQQSSHSIRSIQKCIAGDREIMNTSIGSDIFAIFNQTAMDFSNDINSTTWSEGNISYSSLGMCDQLIQSETQKTEHLASLLKLRERSLIDRFKGQIAWLELQKQKFKEKGLTVEISTIKKKQRALLMRLEKDRKELHRLMKVQKTNPSTMAPNVNYQISHLCTNMSIRRTSTSAKQTFDKTQPKQALKAIEMQGGINLELMLQKRENELRHRREHVEKLLKWHQRLDIEEREIFRMEQMIMMFSATDAYKSTANDKLNDTLAITENGQQQQQQQQQQQKTENSLQCQRESIVSHEKFKIEKQKHIKNIEKSLKTLQNISARSISSDIDGSDALIDELVEVNGHQLNKLWKRLTSQCEEKFTSQKVYKLSKSNLEELYEEAKMVVLKKFHSNSEFKKLIDNSATSIVGDASISKELNTTVVEQVTPTAVETTINNEIVLIPALNLNTSSEASIVSQKENVQSDSDHGYYFTSDSVSNVQSQETKDTVNEREPSKELIENEASIVEESVKSEYASTIADDLIATNHTYIREITDDQNSIIDGVTHSTCHESEDMQSDITEDSLNNPKTTLTDNNIQSDISTAVDEQTSTAHTQSKSNTPMELPNLNDETQMIEDTSFPNIDVTKMINSIVDDDAIIDDSIHSTNPSDEVNELLSKHTIDFDDNKYLSDDFEKTKSTDKSASLSDESSKMNNSENEIVTEIATATGTNSSSITARTKDSTTELASAVQLSRSPSPRPSSASGDIKSKELEQRLIDIDESLKDLNETIARSPVFGTSSSNSSNSISPDEHRKAQSFAENEDERPLGTIETHIVSNKNDENKENVAKKSKTVIDLTESLSPVSISSVPIGSIIVPVKVDGKLRNTNDVFPLNEIFNKNDAETIEPTPKYSSNFIRDYSISADHNKMPEADVLRRSQISLDVEVKNLDQTTSTFPFLREIPNKPPPPYPTHRNPPLTLTFPTDDRIKEIVSDRIKQLHLADENPTADTTFVKSPTQTICISPPTISNDTTINVFERIILDVCEEIMNEFTQHRKHPLGVYKQPLSFYRPPDRLLCMQEYALKRIYKLLGRSNNTNCVMNKTQSCMQQSSVRFLPTQMANMTFNNRRKRDMVDEILIQEMCEDEPKWTNFDLEELEVRNNVQDLMSLLVDEPSSIDESSNVNEDTSIDDKSASPKN